tara:strand:+ start:704 stop:1342 length:639 start_codon:yes stop_codon:yes gene_type:complete
MKTQHPIISLFPTPLYIDYLPEDLLKDHISFLNQEEILHLKRDNYGECSKNTYLLHQDHYKNLNSYILQQATYYAENYLSYNYINYKFSQSWISVKNPEQSHNQHHHPHSLISGVLFYEKNNTETSSITFHRNDKYSETITSHKTKPDNLRNDFSFTSYDIYYKPNTLILFPSFLQHSVSKNTTPLSRKSLAFNIVPKDGFGKKDNLCELKF